MQSQPQSEEEINWQEVILEQTRNSLAMEEVNYKHLTLHLINQHQFQGDSSVKQASAGHNHSALVLVDGRLMTFGCNRQGQLGHGDDQERKRPETIGALAGERVGMVACGGSHTVIEGFN